MGVARFLLPIAILAGIAAGCGGAVRATQVVKPDVRIHGPAANAQTGSSVAVVGDAARHGHADVLVAVFNTGEYRPAIAYLVHGKRLRASVDLAGLENRGFTITGASTESLDGDAFSVAAAGDVNGDGLPDLALGDEYDGAGGEGAGAAYVVFGGRASSNVDLAKLGRGGFKIIGAHPGDLAGASVSSAGDVNGDGLTDVAVATHCCSGEPSPVYVVFGARYPAEVDLGKLGKRGFRIDGAVPEDFFGIALAPAGDVNGDGRPDLIVGAPYDDAHGDGSGAAYVLFGQKQSENVDLRSLGRRGFRIAGAEEHDLTGVSVGGAGDVNGDGLADVVVGANSASPKRRSDFGSSAGAAYVVFGSRSPTNVDLRSLGTHGYRIDGAAGSDGVGIAVAGAGDFNGDGLGDVVIGADGASSNRRATSGSAYVVFGRRSRSEVDLAALGDRGLRIDGTAAGERLGVSAAGAGDVNGDGLADVVVGAKYADDNHGKDSGAAYIVFGRR